MLRLRFEKLGNSIWISHLDLMRLFQRAFQRAGLSLTHSQGFNPRPQVSIAMPLSVGVESGCELLDFDLDGAVPSMEEIKSRLNRALVSGIRVLEVYENGVKPKYLTYLQSRLTLEYDAGIPAEVEQALTALFARETLTVEKKSKSGITQQDLIPLLRQVTVTRANAHTLTLEVLGCAQNPTLNPMQLCEAINRYLPALRPDFARCRRLEVYDEKMHIFR